MSAGTHAHVFQAGIDTSMSPLVLLHGSDGNESDLMPLAADLAPGAPRLGIRGTVAMDAGHGFFRRLPDRRLDESDIAARAPVLASFIAQTCDGYGFTRKPLAIGFSNGAIMSAALLMTDPDLFGAAVLFRPLSPFTRDRDVRLDGTPVLIVDGEQDVRRSPGDGLQVADRLRRLGALVTHHELPVGHSITGADRQLARAWIRRLGM